MENSFTEPIPKVTEILPPQPCTEFHTARLFLSHFGFLSRLDDTNVNTLYTNAQEIIIEYYLIAINYIIFFSHHQYHR